MRRLNLGLPSVYLLASICSVANAGLPNSPALGTETSRSFAAAGLLQAGGGLALILALIFLCAWASRRFGILQQTRSGRLVNVVSSVMVGQRERVVVVEVRGTWLVLGVAAGQVRKLHHLPAEAQPEMRKTAAMVSPAEMPVGSGRFGAAGFSQKLLVSIEKLSTRNNFKKAD